MRLVAYVLIIASVFLARPFDTVAQKQSVPDVRLKVAQGDDGSPCVAQSRFSRHVLGGAIQDDRYLLDVGFGFRRGQNARLLFLEAGKVREVKGFGEAVQSRLLDGRRCGDGLYLVGEDKSAKAGEPKAGVWFINGTSLQRVMLADKPLAGQSLGWLEASNDHVLVDGKTRPVVYRLNGTKAEEVASAKVPPTGGWPTVVLQGKDVLVCTGTGEVPGKANALHKHVDGKLTPVKFPSGDDVKGFPFRIATAGGSLLVFLPGVGGLESMWRYGNGELIPMELSAGKPADNVRPIDSQLSGSYWVVASRDGRNGPETLWVVRGAKVEPVRMKDGKPLTGANCSCACGEDRVLFGVAEKAGGVQTIYAYDGKIAEITVGPKGAPLTGALKDCAQAGKWVVANLNLGEKTGNQAFLLDGPKVINPLSRPDGKLLQASSLQTFSAPGGVYVSETVGETEDTGGTQHLFWLPLK